MDTPRLEIDLKKIRHNTKTIVGLCRQKGVDVVGVTKGASGIPQVAKAMLDGGVSSLADARIRNIDKLKLSGLDSDFMMLRLPRISSAAEVVHKTQASLNSELSIIRSLVKESIKAGKPHGIMYMVDVGDLREGVLYSRAMSAAEQILALKGIDFMGIGTNVGCYGGIIPSEKNMGLLVEIARKIKEKYSVDFPVISVGGTNCLALIKDDKMPREVNQVRIGEGILLGRDSSRDAILENTFQDAFMLSAEIVEMKQKPSVPFGSVGRDAFGNMPVFDNRGVRKRALISLGKQDVRLSGLIPVDRHIRILGGSSDYFILDISDSMQNYSIGDEVFFNLKYPGLLSVTTSPYVNVIFKEEI